jgi:hypothetical protein
MVIQTARSKRAPTIEAATEFSFNSVSPYADKDEFVAKKLIFTIGRVTFEEKAGFEGSDRWAVLVSAADDRPDEIITLQSNDKRDEQLYAAQEHIAKHGPIRNVRLIRSGKAYYFERVAENKAP